MAKLTIKACETLPPGLHPDTAVAGLALRVQSRARSWVLRYRDAGGVQRQLGIGRFPDVHPEDARRIATLRRAEPVAGRDPHRELRSATVGAVIADFNVNHRSRKSGRAPTDDPDLVRRLASIVEAFGERPIADVRRADVARLLARWDDRPFEANRLRALLRQLWGYAVRAELAAPTIGNPAAALAPRRERPRERSTLGAAELARVMTAAAAYPNVHAGLAIQVLIATGARPREVMTLRWDAVDLERGTITWRDRKAGDHQTIPIHAGFVEVFRAWAADAEGPWVFPGNRGGHLTDLRVPWRWIRERAGLRPSTRLYDIRGSVASLLVGAAGLKVAQEVLGHADSRTTLKHYTRPSDEQRRAGVDAIAAALVGAMQGRTQEAPAGVVPPTGAKIPER